ncbi:MAG: peptidase [Roseateles depolymerans]|uniref:Peptidase n=1 Tax=Roseateles depolymerans TaxID=76731 RepID=A0A2W5FQ74_9BURK|nr:MAG: peptidase [Roseateles depolymerans]
MPIKHLLRRGRALAAVAAVAGASLGLMGSAHAAATIIINNLNAAGVGFNDTTPAAPVGGNPGTTLGEQRLFAFTYAANLWGAALTSSQPIIINAQMTALTCTATSATLGSAGSTSTFRDFPNAPYANTLYSYALANKIAGSYLGTANAAQISANFNSNLGMNANCLPGRTWYLGLDGNHGTNIDFIPVLLHEMGHGLGFQTFTNGSTGAQSGGRPSIWDRFLLGTVTGKHWYEMTNAERAASAISMDKLVWDGPAVTAAVPSVLAFGLASATFTGSAAGPIAGTVRVGEADFGPNVGTNPVYGEVMPVVEQTAGAGEGCEAFNAVNARAVNGKVAFITLGVCTVATKAKNAQNAGATAVLIGDTVAETAVQPIPLGGWDRTLVIPSVRLFVTDAAKLRTSLLTRSRTTSGVFVSLGRNGGAQYAGADPLGRALMYAPNPFISGSSVSHFDRTMFRNQLMEPNISNDLGISLIPPEDMTLRLLQDIGW